MARAGRWSRVIRKDRAEQPVRAAAAAGMEEMYAALDLRRRRAQIAARHALEAADGRPRRPDREAVA